MGLEILSDLSEVIHYPIADFPLFAGVGQLEQFNQFAVSCHWHYDFEFNLVLEGSMDYFVNGENIHLDTGDGIFVNNCRLHYNYSREKVYCRYLVITIAPELFSTDLPPVKQFIEEKSDRRHSDYLILEREKHKSILAYFPLILQEIQQQNINPLRTLSYAAALCGESFLLIQSGVRSDKSDIKWLSLHDMTEYIHLHYDNNITLSDIAAAGRICRSKCCQLFSSCIGQSPIDYLISYRLTKSCEMLYKSDCNIVEIAAKCGFSGQSYFTSMFRKTYGLTPREYRKQKSLNTAKPHINRNRQHF